MDDELFLRVKQTIALFFGLNRDDVSLEGNICTSVDIREAEYGKPSTIDIFISASEIRESVEKVAESNSGNLEMILARNYYECAVGFEGYVPLDRRMIDKIPLIEDHSDGLSYSIGLCSFDYCILLLIQYARERRSVDPGELVDAGRFHNAMMRRRRLCIEEELPGWKDYLPVFMGFNSLKIKSTHFFGRNEANDRAASFEFKFMYCTGRSIRRYRNNIDFFFRRRTNYHRMGSRVFDTIPKKKYDEGAVDYYRLALSTNDPYVQYLSFYHVLEFYFSKSFKKGVSEKLKTMITKASFSLTEEKLYEVAAEINREMGSKQDLGYSGERNELRYVLLEHVSDIEDLKESIGYYDSSSIEYYRSNGVDFANNAPSIIWENEKGIHDQLTSRIYQTRNALIHSKDQSDRSRYRPFNDEAPLAKEIPLVRSLAEIVIDASGECY